MLAAIREKRMHLSVSCALCEIIEASSATGGGSGVKWGGGVHPCKRQREKARTAEQSGEREGLMVLQNASFAAKA